MSDHKKRSDADSGSTDPADGLDSSQTKNSHRASKHADPASGEETRAGTDASSADNKPDTEAHRPEDGPGAKAEPADASATPPSDQSFAAKPGAATQKAGHDADKRSGEKNTSTSGTATGESGSSHAPDKDQKDKGDSRSSNATGRNSSGGDGSRRTAASGGDGGRPSRGPTIIALVALLLALMAIGIGVWLAVDGWQRLQGTQDRVESLARTVDTLQNDVEASDSQRRQRVQNLADQLRAQGEQLAAIRNQLATIKKRNQQLANAIAGTERMWQLRRIRSLLLAANRVLQLQEDVPAAITALELADRRAAALNDPSLLALRKQLAAQISQLRALPTVDRVGVALRLANAARHVRQMPLAGKLPERFVGSGEAGDDDGDPGAVGTQSGADAPGPAESQNARTSGDRGWLATLQAAGQRALDSIGHALGSLVIVRRTDTPPPELLPPARAAYLARNLALALKNAEAAILRGHPRLYRKNLATALHLLRQYYDRDNPRVSALISQLKRLQSVDLIAGLPTISGSLKIVDELIAEQSDVGKARANAAASPANMGSAGAGKSTIANAGSGN